MSTHYELRVPGSEPCEHCGRADREVRLPFAQTAGGWRVALHGLIGRDLASLGVDRLMSLAEWTTFIESHPDATIIDEYDRRWSWSDFLERVEQDRHKIVRSGHGQFSDGPVDISEGWDWS